MFRKVVSSSSGTDVLFVLFVSKHMKHLIQYRGTVRVSNDSINIDSSQIMANVFGALNRFISRLDSDSQAQTQSSGAQGAYGFQVLRNSNAELPLEPWFDFIIGVNGRTLV